MIFIKNNRAQGHIELILSFVIFLGFVLVLLIFLNPLKNGTNNYVMVDDLQEKILNNLSVNFLYSPLSINTSIGGSCFYISNPFVLGSKILVSDSSGNTLNSRSDNLLYIAWSGTFYNLYSAEFFNYTSSGLSACDQVDSGDYELGAPVLKSLVLYENLQIFNESYLFDYELLKSNLGIESEFGFTIYNFNREVLFNESLSARKLRTGNVYSREIPLQTINKNADTDYILLRLRTWK